MMMVIVCHFVLATGLADCSSPMPYIEGLKVALASNTVFNLDWTAQRKITPEILYDAENPPKNRQPSP